MKKNIIIGAFILIVIFFAGFYLLSVNRTSVKISGQESTSESYDISDQVTIRIFDKNVSDEAFDDDVAKEIMKRTGVRIEIEDATDNAADKSEAMLRDKSYPDIVLLEQGDLVNHYIESGALIPLDDLVEEYGQNIKEMYGDILQKSRYSDGKLYWFANWYGKDTDASAGVLMRKDILTELVGKKRANSHKAFTLSEYTEILRKFKEKYPVLEGHFSVALELNSDSENYLKPLQGMFGLKNFGIESDGSLHYLPNTEKYREAILYLNQLYDEGLLDKEWVINKTERCNEKMSDGYVFSTWGSYWDTDAVNEQLSQKCGKDAKFYCYKVVADGMSADETTYNARNSLGWDAIGITDNCKNVKAAMKVLDFLASEEGQYLMLWGLEGKTWNMVNGKHNPSLTFLKEWGNYSESIEQETGVRRWTWMIKNGYGSDETPYDLTTKYAPSDVTVFANASFGESDYWDTSEYSGLEPTVSSDCGFQWQNIQDIYDQAYTKIVCASSSDQAQILYDRMLEDMKLAGLDKCEEYITQKHKERMESWNQ